MQGKLRCAKTFTFSLSLPLSLPPHHPPAPPLPNPPIALFYYCYYGHDSNNSNNYYFDYYCNYPCNEIIPFVYLITISVLDFFYVFLLCFSLLFSFSVFLISLNNKKFSLFIFLWFLLFCLYSPGQQKVWFVHLLLFLLSPLSFFH